MGCRSSMPCSKRPSYPRRGPAFLARRYRQKAELLCDVAHAFVNDRCVKLRISQKELTDGLVHIATGTITALLATVLVYLSHWPSETFRFTFFRWNARRAALCRCRDRA